jgi:hypothetical protein
MATAVHRVHLPSAHPVYDGTGKTLDEAIVNAHKKIPRHPHGPSLNKETNELVAAPKGAVADVLIRCQVIEIGYESGGPGASQFLAKVIEV